MNKFKNEMIIKMGEVEILLRPTFENIANMEGDIGGLAYIAHKFTKPGKGMMGINEAAKIIFYNQAEKNYSLDEIWELVSDEGIQIIGPVMQFLTKITMGNKMAPILTETQKKS